jgi:hypothetical protein
MMINTLAEATEYFEHNPKDKIVYFVMLTESDLKTYDISKDDVMLELDVLHTEENK